MTSKQAYELLRVLFYEKKNMTFRHALRAIFPESETLWLQTGPELRTETANSEKYRAEFGAFLIHWGEQLGGKSESTH